MLNFFTHHYPLPHLKSAFVVLVPPVELETVLPTRSYPSASSKTRNKCKRRKKRWTLNARRSWKKRNSLTTTHGSRYILTIYLFVSCEFIVVDKKIKWLIFNLQYFIAADRESGHSSSSFNLSLFELKFRKPRPSKTNSGLGMSESTDSRVPTHRQITYSAGTSKYFKLYRFSMIWCMLCLDSLETYIFLSMFV